MSDVEKNSLDLLDFEENDFRETRAWNSWAVILSWIRENTR